MCFYKQGVGNYSSKKELIGVQYSLNYLHKDEATKLIYYFVYPQSGFITNDYKYIN